MDLSPNAPKLCTTPRYNHALDDTVAHDTSLLKDVMCLCNGREG